MLPNVKKQRMCFETKTERKGCETMETKTRTYEKFVPRAQPMPLKEKQNQPLKKFKAGSIAATIWENQNRNDDGQMISFKNVSFERHYKDASGALLNPHLPLIIHTVNKHLYLYKSINLSITYAILTSGGRRVGRRGRR